MNCYNCGTPLGGPYCAACGQKAGPLDPTLHDFLHDFSHEMLHVDGRIFRSVASLVAKPGFLTREYFQGRRARWVSPIRLYLIFSLAYFAAAAFAASHDVIVEPPNDPEATAFLQRLGFGSVTALKSAVEDARTHWGPRAMFVLVPVMAWLIGLAWRRRGKHYPQQLYAALHVHAAWFAMAALIAVAGILIPRPVAANLDSLLVVYGFVYLVLTFRVAYGGTWMQSVVRGAFVLTAYYVVVGLVAMAIALLVIFGHRKAADTASQTSAAITLLSRAASSLTQPALDAWRT